MSGRTLYLAAAAAWGGTFGLLGSIAVFALGLRIIPPTSGGVAAPSLAIWLVSILAVLLGLLILAACLMAGRRLRRHADVPGALSQHDRRVGFAALVGWAVATPILFAALFWTADTSRIETFLSAGRAAGPGQHATNAAFERLAASRHTVDRVDFFGWNADTGSAGIVMRGNRTGDNAITWQISESANGQVLAEGTESVTLGPGRRTVVINLDRTSLITAYRESFPAAKKNGKFELEFVLAVVVEPILSSAERDSLPSQDLQELTGSQSPLRSGGEVKVPITFRLSSAAATQTD